MPQFFSKLRSQSFLVCFVCLLTTYTANASLKGQWVKVHASSAHSLAIKPDGTLWAWGENIYGQLGDGTTINRNIPVQVGSDNNWQSITAGATHSLAIKTDGTLWTWGDNIYGQLGDGTTKQLHTPAQIGSDTNWQNVEAGSHHSLAIKTDGTLWAWGRNNFGQLGDGSTTQRNNPVQIGSDTDWQDIAAGASRSLAIKTNGTLWAWGANNGGLLGDGTSTTRTAPIKIEGDSNWQSIAAGEAHSLAIKTDGTLWGWGRNNYGQLGDGTTIDRNAPVKIGYDTNWQRISSGLNHSLAVKIDGTLWAWGSNIYGILGDGTTTQRITPVQIGNDANWQSISAGDSHSTAIKSVGTLWAWGEYSGGILGFLDRKSKPATAVTYPVQDTPYIKSEWLSIAAGVKHTVGIKTDGTLWAWGYNRDGQLGDGTTMQRSTPVQIGSDANWQSIAARGSRSFAINSDGSLWAWGSGRLGDGTSTNRTAPVKIESDTNWRSIVAGKTHSLAIKADGTLWAWGSNNQGQLGDGTTNSPVFPYFPVKIGNNTDWQSITAGESHSLAIKADGTLWSWGNNSGGQLGDGTSISQYSPIQIGSDTNWQSAVAANHHNFAIKSDGTLWSWGANTYGVLGDGTSAHRITPMQIGSNTNWQSISTGDSHALAITSAGTLWAWGNNEFGQLGDGTRRNHSPPVQIESETNWQSIAAGAYFTLAIEIDGTLWAWGSNYFGELGDDSEIRRISPVTIAYSDSDGDGVPDHLDGAPYDVNELLDNDNDGIGDNADTDDDNDGISDEYEITIGLNPFEFDDVLLDNDGDGVVLSDEFLFGSYDNNPNSVPPVAFFHSFETRSCETEFSVDAAWTISSNVAIHGRNSCQVKGLENGSSASLIYQNTFDSGYFSFTLKTSTEAQFDELVLSVDGKEIARYSGEQDWEIYRYAITAGMHSIRWRYSKDSRDSVGEDAVWIDSIVLPVNTDIDTDGDGITDNIDTDDDNDGLLDSYEIEIGTDPLLIDSDEDGINDNIDAFPLDSGESVDTDLDGIGNNADTDDDNDGLPDTYELANSLDPLDFADAAIDNDGDSLSNFDEFRFGTNVNLADTDGDGINDNIDNNPLIFDEPNPALYSGQLTVLPDITDDGIKEVGILKVNTEKGQVNLDILNGQDLSLIKTIIWFDSFVDTTLALHVIPDMNDNGVDEIGLFGVQETPNNEGKPQMFVRDLLTGNRVSVFNWPANWKGVSALVLNDMSGDGIAEIGVQGRFKDGNRPQLVVRNGANGSSHGTYGYPNIFASPLFYQHSDVDGDGFEEIATFGRITRNNKIQIKIASGIGAEGKLKAYNFPDKWSNVSWHRLDDSNVDGIDDWGLFGISRADGRPQLVNKDGSNPKGALRIYAWPADMNNAKFYRIPDMNYDGVDEVAAAGRRSNGRYQFIVKDGLNRNSILANHNLNLNLEDVTYHVLPDLSGDEQAEIGFMGINLQGEYELVIRHGDTANGDYARHNLGRDWQSAPAITSLGDTDDDGLADLLVYGQNAAADRLVIMPL